MRKKSKIFLYLTNLPNGSVFFSYFNFAYSVHKVDFSVDKKNIIFFFFVCSFLYHKAAMNYQFEFLQQGHFYL